MGFLVVILFFGCLSVTQAIAQRHVENPLKAAVIADTKQFFLENADKINTFQLEATAQSTEEAAVIAVIKAETEAAFARDVEAWKATWLHDSRASQTHVSGGNYRTFSGWDNIYSWAMEWLKNNLTPSEDKLSYENFNVRLEDGLAWAEYDQRQAYMENNQNKEWLSRQQRTLVKEDGVWKITSMTIIHVQSLGPSAEAIEANINTNGYHLLQANKVKEAIEVFKLNVALFPDAWNTYDSLGEAYAVEGNKKQAIKNYEKSIALNPDNEIGKKALVKLRMKERASVKK